MRVSSFFMYTFRSCGLRSGSSQYRLRRRFFLPYTPSPPLSTTPHDQPTFVPTAGAAGLGKLAGRSVHAGSRWIGSDGLWKSNRMNKKLGTVNCPHLKFMQFRSVPSHGHGVVRNGRVFVCLAFGSRSTLSPATVCERERDIMLQNFRHDWSTLKKQD